ncbi:hypothetical protein L1987_20531 [Smallanthus sonchifolius]|uniref:Uncharacterized protein n=1 Tax=Smallanthus sonchifolius TaxID=185202 RepID=A0ACB9ITS3_9ASTR|nr:hypothetical protein L1987_20531 [Smallanthus sonchifolius]
MCASRYISRPQNNKETRVLTLITDQSKRLKLLGPKKLRSSNSSSSSTVSKEEATPSVVTTPITTQATTIPSTVPITTLHTITQPFTYGDFSQGFDFDDIFSSPIHGTGEASTSRDPDPSDARIAYLETQMASLLDTVNKSRSASEAQQVRINSLIDEVTHLRHQWTGTQEQLRSMREQAEMQLKVNESILAHRQSVEARLTLQRDEHQKMVALVEELTKKACCSGGEVEA